MRIQPAFTNPRWSLRNGALICSTLALTACASVITPANQTVAVQTSLRSGVEISGVGCELVNDKGAWFMVTPGYISVRRSAQDMQVYCNKKGYETGRAAVVPESRSAVGTVILGPGDTYPGLLKIVMGDSLVIQPVIQPAVEHEDNAAVKVAEKAPEKEAEKTPATFSSTLAGATVDEKLRELNRLYNAGLITREVYVEKQKWVLEGR